MSLVVASTIDVTVILAAALSAGWVLRRQSAALRHALLAAAIVMATLAPVFEAVLPQWSVSIPRSASGTLQASAVGFVDAAAVSVPDTETAASRPEPIDWGMLLVAAWTVGAAVGLAGLSVGLIRLRRIVRRCRRLEGGRWRQTADEIARAQALGPITLLQSAERTLLVTYGWRRPRIVLPADCDAWSDERCRIVLGHELAHIRRGDWATQMLAELLRIAFWFHPLAWRACSRLRQESEYACDDIVMARGVEPTDYATHLLEVARHAVGRRAPWVAAPAIAQPSTLERRIAVMLNPHRNHAPLGRRSAAVVAAGSLALAMSVAGVSATGEQSFASAAVVRDVALAAPEAAAAEPKVPPTSAAGTLAPTASAPAGRVVATAPLQDKPASISGTLYDPLGGVLPGVALTLADQTVGVTYTSTTDANGGFAFRDLQPATYELRARLPGFSSVSTVMPIGAGANLERRIVLPIGTLQETVTVTCSFTNQPPTPRPRAVLQPRGAQTQPAAVSQPIAAAPFNGGIGGQIKVPRQIAKANPICPNHVGIDTTVLLSARVGIDGYLSDIKDLRNEGKQPQDQQPQEIVDSAIDAVRLWQYTPTLLNGVPVEVNIMVTVQYTWQ